MDGANGDSCTVHPIEFIVASSDGPVAFYFSIPVLHLMALSIFLFIKIRILRFVFSCRNNILDTKLIELLSIGG